MKNKVIIMFIFLVAYTHTTFLSMETTCHPQCSWKCDDPHCPAICDPVCEPPKCHTSCAEPKNAICDVKCEKPQCEIKCPDKGCELLDCPKCVTVCQQPHCVTHCQAPKPECEPVCEEPKCDWKCHKPSCPKPKCELVCENPNCVPKVECCNCAMGAPMVAMSMPFFKETEKNKDCCGCNGAPSSMIEISQVQEAKLVKPLIEITQAQAETKMTRSIHDFGTHVVQEDLKVRTALEEHPQPIGDSYYNRPNQQINAFENTVPRYTVG